MLILASGIVAVSPRARPVRQAYLPATVEQALEVQRECLALGAAGTYAMGTTDLVADIRAGRAVTSIISLTAIRDLRCIEETPDGLFIGAGVTHSAGSANADVRRLAPNFAAAWGRIANVRVRYRATIGGNLSARKHRYELPVMLDALDARLHVLDPLSGKRRTRSVAEYVEAPPETGELLQAVSLDSAHTLRFSYDRSMRPLQTVAVAVVERSGALELRLAVGSERERYNARQAHLDLRSLESGRSSRADIADELTEGLVLGTDESERAYRKRLTRVQVTRMLERWAGAGRAERE